MSVFLIKALQLIVALSLLVLVHEFGHYFFARLFGIRVEKFYMFFNPRLSLLKYNPAAGTLELGVWVDKEEKSHPACTIRVGKDRTASGEPISGWRQTIYGIGWLPLGGYCSIAGMIDETQSSENLASEPQSWEFRSKPAWQRLFVMVGGVLFNFIGAVIIYIGIAYSWGEQCVKFRDAYAGMDYVESALKVGFRNGDIPLMADGEEVEATDPDAILKLAQSKVVTVLRNGSDTVNIALPKEFLLDLNDDKGFFAYRLPVVVASTMNGEPAAKAGLQQGDRIVAVGDSLTPAYTELMPALMAYAGQSTTVTVERNGSEVVLPVTPTEDGKLGFALTPITEIYPIFTREYSLLESIPRGWNTGTSTLGNYAASMKHIFSRRGAESIGGFGALGSMFPERWNWFTFWNLTALLSVVLAFMNILPIPALDGGHILFLLYEVVTRRRPSDRFLEVAQYIGMSLLFLLLLYANANDIYRFFLK
jgi:regulator of sigma E protease